MRIGVRNSYPYPLWWELAFALAAVALLAFFFFPLLVGQTTLSHDNFYWDYPLFHYVAESLAQGHIPLWNPMSHGGEPFYPVMGQVRLWEPVTLLTIYFGRFFSHDTLVLFNWDKLIQTAILLFGIYLFFRPRTDHWITRFSLILILSFSSITIGHFRQDGILSQFMWVPFILILTNKIVFEKDYRWRHWFLLSALLGLKCQTYWFTGISIFYLFFIVGLVLFHRDVLVALLRAKANYLKIAMLLVVLAGMLLPDFVLLGEKNDFVFPARMVDKSKADGPPEGRPYPFESGPSHLVDGIQMPYSLIAYSGSFTSFWDVIQALTPDGNQYTTFPYLCHLRWGGASESYLFFGILVWVLGLVGLFLGKDKYKKFWLFLIGGFFLLMLGPAGGLHRVLYPIFPPLWFVRHTHALVLYLEFFFLYFYLLGANLALQAWQRAKSAVVGKIAWRWVLAYAATILFSFSACAILEYPLNQWVFAWLIFAAAVSWLLRKRLSRAVFCTATVVCHLVLVLGLHPTKYQYLTYTMWAMILPAGFFLLLISLPRTAALKARLLPWVGMVFLAITALDLIYGFRQASSLYLGTRAPSAFLDVDTKIKPLAALQPRKIHEVYPAALYGEQFRYLALLYGRSYVFSPLYDSSGKELTFEQAISAPRWGSFLQLRNYFDLIHSGLTPQLLQTIFAVNQDPIQFKSEIVSLGDADIFSYFADLGRDKSVALLQNVAIVQGKQPPDGLARIPPASGSRLPQSNLFNYRVNRYTYDNLQFTAGANQAGNLLWSDGYDRHWRAYVDGKEVAVMRANGNSKLIRLPLGTHEVEFDYQPTDFLAALKVFYGLLIGCLVFGATAWLAPNRR